MMKRISFLCLLLACLLAFSGCSGSGAAQRNKNTNQVEQALDEQIAAAEGKASDVDGGQGGASVPTTDGESSYGEVDFDLTDMNSDMVYSTVFNMLDNPEGFVGKTVRTRGTLAVFRNEKSGAAYYTCLIKDAAACCAQGMEFVWDDGDHDSSEHPPEGSNIEVTGEFETYTEDNALYCRLKHAEMKQLQLNIQ